MCIQVSVSDLELGQLYGVLSIQDTELKPLADNMSARIQTSEYGYTCMTFGACVDTDSFMILAGDVKNHTADGKFAESRAFNEVVLDMIPG